MAHLIHLFISTSWHSRDISGVHTLVILLIIQLPWVAEKLLLTISVQYQADSWWESSKKYIRGLRVDPIPNSPNLHVLDKNCMTDSKENYMNLIVSINFFSQNDLTRMKNIFLLRFLFSRWLLHLEGKVALLCLLHSLQCVTSDN